MYNTENSLIYLITEYEFIKCNIQKTVFYNTKKGEFIKSTKNGGSYGIWVNSDWLSISKIELTQEVENKELSNDLSNLLKDLKPYS